MLPTGHNKLPTWIKGGPPDQEPNCYIAGKAVSGRVSPFTHVSQMPLADSVIHRQDTNARAEFLSLLSPGIGTAVQ